MVQETRNGFIEIILQRNSVTENRSGTKKVLQPTGLKNNLGRGIYPPTTVFLSFLKHVMSSLGSVILLNLSDQVYFLQVFSFVVCSFRLSHGENGLRCKRKKKYRLNILVWSLHRVREGWRGIREKTKTFYTGWIAWKNQAKKEEIEEENLFSF